MLTTLTATETDPTPAAPFSFESGAVMRRLRTAVSDMLRGLPTRVRTTRDLQKAFGVDVKLCWQVMKLAGPGDALGLVPFVPTPGPMRRFLAAATSAGVDPGVVGRIRSAYEAFGEQVSIHAGDRVTFEAMATGMAGLHERDNEDLHKSAVRLRKAAFQTASYYAGCQLDTYLGMSFVHPSAATPGSLDAAFLRVKLGIRRLRPTADLNVDSSKLVTTDAGIDGYQDTSRKQPFDPAAVADHGAAVLPRFSSSPLPPLHTVADASGSAFTRIVGDSVGQQSAVNLAFGQFVTGAPMTALYDGRKRGFATSLDMTSPTGVVILDKLVHRPSFPNLELDFDVNWMYAPHPAVAGPWASTPLPFAERLVRLGAGVDGARTHEVPNYTEMVEYVCDHRRWNIDEFDVYRVRVESPLQFTRLWTKFVPVPTPGT